MLPILEGDRLIGRLDPKVDRDAGILRIRRVWWEPGIKPSPARARKLDAALASFAGFNGIQNVEFAERAGLT